MSKEVTETKGTELVASTNLDDWGDTPMSAKDLVIPKILPQQPASQYVMEEKAAFGDFCHSLTGEILGSVEKPLTIIPILMDKIWIISKKVEGDFKFEKVEPVTPATENLSWRDVEGGVEVKREYVRNFYVLIEGHDMPFVISFKGMSSNAGKILATQMYTLNRMAGIVPAGQLIELAGKKEKNEKGRFLVLSVRPLERTPEALVTKARDWKTTLDSGILKVDNSDLGTGGKQGELFDTESKF